MQERLIQCYNLHSDYVCVQVLCGLYAKIQSILQQMPKDAAYHTHTQQIVQQRLQIVQAVSKLSHSILEGGCGLFPRKLI